MALERLRKLALDFGLGRGSQAPAWSIPRILDHGALGAADLALDQLGRGAAVWENGGDLWTTAAGPRAAGSLVRLPLGTGEAPRVVLNAQGRGLALWAAHAAEQTEIHARILGTGGGAERPLFRSGGRVTHVQGAVDRRGNALVVWLHEPEAGPCEVLALTFDARAHAWQEAPAVLGRPTDPAARPRVAVNHRQHAMVLWEVQDPIFEGLVASHHWPSEQLWSDRPMPVVTRATRDHQVAMDDAGNAVALWVRAPYRELQTLEASFYDAHACEWGEPQVLASAEALLDPRLAFTGCGEALAAWRVAEDRRVSRVFVKGFQGRGWSSAAACLDLGQTPIREFVVDLAPGGRASLLAVHQSQEGDWVSIRERQETWEPPVVLQAADGQRCRCPRLALGPSGAAALWIHGSGAGQSLKLATRGLG